MQSHFPSHNNVFWLTNCFESLQWKILVGDMYFFQYNFHPHTNANNCGKLQKNGITIWWSNRWFVLNSIVFSIYLSQSHLWQNIPNTSVTSLENSSRVCLWCKQQNIKALWNSNYFELIVTYLLKSGGTIKEFLWGVGGDAREGGEERTGKGTGGGGRLLGLHISRLFYIKTERIRLKHNCCVFYFLSWWLNMGNGTYKVSSCLIKQNSFWHNKLQLTFGDFFLLRS